MPAPKGNKYAEKWTQDTVIEAIDRVHEYNVLNKGNYVLKLALTETGLYPDAWAYFADKFSENGEVFRAIKKTEDYLEARIVNSTMSGDAKSAAMAIFLLKNKYGYEDTHKYEGMELHVVMDDKT